MKNLLLAILFIGSFSVFAQPDVEAKLVSPPDGGSFTAGVQFNFDVRIINRGTVNIDAQDTIIYAPVVNGSLIQTAQGVPLVYTAQATINSGDSATFSEPLNLSGGTPGQLTFCAIVAVAGNGWTGVMESDTVNNLGCNMVNYNGGSVSNPEFTVVETIDNSYFAGGIYHIEMENISFVDQPLFRVFNITGQEVMSTRLMASGNRLNQEVELHNLNRGVYIIQIMNGSNSVSTKKIVVN